jgi:iron complex transport system substrate-binding protein
VKKVCDHLVPLILAGVLISCSAERPPDVDRQRRIISLSPHITEIIYALGADSDLVAVTGYCRYPSRVKEKETIGGLYDPNLEKIVRLAPTHLFGVPAHAKLNQNLQHFNLPVIMLANETIADVIGTIDTLGQILDCRLNAKILIDSIYQDLEIVKIQKRAGEGPSAMLVIGKEPGSLQNLMVAGEQTFLNELWILAGGRNAFPDLPVRYAQVNLEGIISRNPQIIVQFDPNRPAGFYRDSTQAEWRYLKNTEAVKKNNIYVVGGDYVFIPGPRLTMLTRQFAALIQQVTSR